MKRNNEFTLRGFFIGLIGLIIITASSLYVALRMGALPWPTVFVTVVSLTVLRRFKNSSLQEINVTHTMMSSGAMVAGGVAFTLPGIWILNPQAEVNPLSLVILTMVGALLGTLFTALGRKRYIVEKELPYPMGQAAYNTLIAGTQKGKGAKLLFSALALSVLFTVFRDGVPLIPAVLVLFAGSALVPALSIWVSPMAAGIGAIIGPALSLTWLGGALLAYLVITPAGIALNLFSNMAAADLFRQNLGIGLMVGTGVGILLKSAYQKLKGSRAKAKITVDWKSQASLLTTLVIVVALVTLTLFTEISFIQALLTILGIYLATQLAATLTGETGINPMEILGILVLLAIQIIYSPTTLAAFSIAGVTAIASGLTGDMMNDLKSGYLVGTQPKNQIIAEGIGGLIGAIVAIVALFVLKEAYGGFSSELLPAPQARAVTAMVGGLGHKAAFISGFIIALALYFGNIPAATLGLGVYLPINISLIMGIGAIIYLVFNGITKREKRPLVKERTALIASGLLGGEGITGVLLAIIAMFL
ncbi:MAG: OPT/YSL family transporter [Sphaerochaetaceae bacterium]